MRRRRLPFQSGSDGREIAAGEIDRLVDEKRRELQRSLEPVFHDEGNNTAAILIDALRHEFGYPTTKDDRPRFLAALARLPRGHAAKPTRLFNRHEDGRSFFTLIFSEGGMLYYSSKRFDTEDAADRYASWFLMRLAELRGEAAPAHEP
jgi:hypothetical protein